MAPCTSWDLATPATQKPPGCHGRPPRITGPRLRSRGPGRRSRPPASPWDRASGPLARWATDRPRACPGAPWPACPASPASWAASARSPLRQRGSWPGPLPPIPVASGGSSWSTRAGFLSLAVTWIRTPGRSGPSPPRSAGPGSVGRITLTIPVTILGVERRSGIESPGPARAGPDGLRPGQLGPVLSAIAAAGAAVLTQAHIRGSAGGRADTRRADGGRADGGRATRVTDPARSTGSQCRHENSVPGYRIPGRLRALIEARDQYCRFPICGRPATQCDIDHTVPYDQGGLSCECNLFGPCRCLHTRR